MRILARRTLREERAIALPLALMVLTVLSIAATSSLYSSTRAGADSSQSRGMLVAGALAEAGLNNAMSVLAKPSNNAMEKALLPSRTTAYEGGKVTWSGTLDEIAAIWTIRAVGVARAGPGRSGVTVKRLSAKVPVYPTMSQPLNNPAWNYVFSRGTGQVCDTTVGNTVDIKSPFYVEGNLCLINTARVSGGPLAVHGKLTMNQSANTIGTSAVPVNEVHIANGCQWFNNASHNPCQIGAGSAGKDNVFATIFSNTPTPINAPVPLWDEWYTNASPGPYYGCSVVSTGPVPVFDNDQGTTPNIAKRNNSVLTVFDMTPGVPYSCKTAMGELTWNPATKLLTISGTIFIDGSAKVENGAINRYNGYATIYLSGTMLFKGAKMCALVSADGTACTTAGWDPNARMMVIVANGKGGQVPSDTSIQLATTGGFQGALYATWAIEIGQSALSEGPLDGAPVKLGQSSASTFPSFTVVPAGMPGNPAVYAQPGAPQGYTD